MKAELECRFGELNDTLSKMRERKIELEGEIARLIRALAGGDGVQSVTAAIGASCYH